MKNIFLLLCCSFLSYSSFSQNVGIGTPAPNIKAILDVQSTDKGVLFPRLTTAQRNAILNPPNGLHIFNVDERCLNVYDSTYQIWNCYCDDCKTVVINITQDVCKLNFYEAYAKAKPASKYVINIGEDVYIHGCGPGDTALSFSTMPFNASITINNNSGIIAGSGGAGGKSTLETGCSGLGAAATPGLKGAHAISSKLGITITINNSGVIAGGGGGGGGSRTLTTGYAGGGGGGAGFIPGVGGAGGGTYSSGAFGCYLNSNIAQPGATGNTSTGGSGGAGAFGGQQGANGGNRGQAGQNGTGSLSAAGGLAGKAIAGGSGNIINNINGGLYYGAID